MKSNAKYKQTEIGEIPEDWNLCALGEVAEITSSKRIFASEYLANGIPFYRGKEVIEKNAGNAVSTELFISENKYNEIKEKFGVPQENDILLTSVGTLGVPYRVSESDKFYFKDGNITWFKKLDEPTSRYLFHWLNSDIGKRKLLEKSIGSTQQALTIVALKSIKIALPQIQERQQIVSILSSLDDKIELNRRMNKTLEEIGKTLFKQWFVDFEFPNENGEPYKSSGGEMVEDELGLIPKGWNASRVGEIATLKSGFAFKGSSFKDSGKYGVIKIKNVIDPGVDVMDIQFVSEEEVKDSARQFILNSGDILIAMSGNTTGKIGILVKGDYELVLNQRVGKYFLKNTSYHWYLYFLLRSGDIQKSIVEKAYGSAQPNISPSLLEDITLLIPDNNVLKKFNDISSHLMKSYIKNYTEKIKLIKLRDSLLPRLMSGRIRVN